MSRGVAYAHQPVYYSASPNQPLVTASLKTQRQRDGVLHTAAMFMHRTVLLYRGKRCKAFINCLPVLQDDEATKKGMASVVVKMLFRLRLIERNPTGLKPEFVAPAGIDRRWAIVAADGLSHERWRQFESELLDLESDLDYEQHYEYARAFRRALDQVLLGVGDLHAALFHTLGSVYRLFYGGFLQPIQLALGFKRIEWMTSCMTSEAIWVGDS
mmetsp:Transcript_25210/g.41872  ORF Transcript_25210/g.41872 Transcript_25210/m.41872 type:complete len:214 (+) Transcript_25210:796-1437(+)